MTQVRPGKPSNRRALLFRDVNLAWETWPFETFVSSTHSADVLLSRSPERSRRAFQYFTPPFHHKNFSCLRTRFMILISEQTRVNQCPLRGNLPCRKLRRAFALHSPALLAHAELRAPRVFPAMRERAIILCTTRVAVISSLLDNTKSSRSNPVCAKKFLREVFHAAKMFCASMPPVLLTEIFFRPGTRSH